MGRRIGIYLVGLAITALGIALIILSFIGAGPWDTVAVGMNNYFGLTIGTWAIFSQVIFLVITRILEKTRLRIESIIPIVIRSCFLDIWVYLVLRNVDFSFSWEVQWITFITGLILTGVGMGIYMEAQFPKTPIDGLMVAISNRFGWSFNVSRTCIEVSGVILGFLLGGPVGLGTLLTALFLGKIIQVSNHRIKKVLHVQTTSL
ncbi:YczE/YyaS/YitT family protein [Alkalihalobacterium alkalinitrilicum]|uniref:YczE/YyaS/YitT family protein n=1 Tax=Alkalihalobacterium alkalinitrilicum TaxID=427920 RepID=UPI0009953DF5|nr:BCR, YitT family protein [Alkalihalobacterium alkalinitrilicum]